MRRRVKEDENGQVSCLKQTWQGRTGPKHATCTEIWQWVHNWIDLVSLNRMYLQGWYCCTPYSIRSVPDEWDPIMPCLKSFHDYGFITTDCSIGTGYTRPAEVTEFVGSFQEVQRRPYLKFAMPSSFEYCNDRQVSKMIEALAAREDVVFQFQRKYERDGVWVKDVNWKQATDDDGNFALVRSRWRGFMYESESDTEPRQRFEEREVDSVLAALDPLGSHGILSGPSPEDWLIEYMLCPNSDLHSHFHGTTAFPAWDESEPYTFLIAGKIWNEGLLVIERALRQSIEYVGIEQMCPEIPDPGHYLKRRHWEQNTMYGKYTVIKRDDPKTILQYMAPGNFDPWPSGETVRVLPPEHTPVQTSPFFTDQNDAADSTSWASIRGMEDGGYTSEMGYQDLLPLFPDVDVNGPPTVPALEFHTGLTTESNAQISMPLFQQPPSIDDIPDEELFSYPPVRTQSAQGNGTAINFATDTEVSAEFELPSLPPDFDVFAQDRPVDPADLDIDAEFAQQQAEEEQENDGKSSSGPG